MSSSVFFCSSHENMAISIIHSHDKNNGTIYQINDSLMYAGPLNHLRLGDTHKVKYGPWLNTDFGGVHITYKTV